MLKEKRAERFLPRNGGGLELSRVLGGDREGMLLDVEAPADPRELRVKLSRPSAMLVDVEFQSGQVGAGVILL